MTAPTPRKKSLTTIVIVLVVLAVCCAGSIPVVGILAAIAIPNFVAYQLRAKRAELPPNLEGIRTAEMAYFAAFDRYLPVPEPVPVDPLMLSGSTTPWPSGTAFDDLGWSPDGVVRGTYWVEVSGDGQSFTAHAMSDLDLDGEPAHYIATETTRATMESPGWAY